MFFYGERPRVEQRLQICGRVEVARLAPKEKVRGKQRHGGDTGPEPFEVKGHEHEIRRDARRRDDREERRKYPPDSPFVKSCERKTTRANIAGDDRRDEIAGNHEKDVHANEAATERLDPGV